MRNGVVAFIDVIFASRDVMPLEVKEEYGHRTWSDSQDRVHASFGPVSLHMAQQGVQNACSVCREIILFLSGEYSIYLLIYQYLVSKILKFKWGRPV